MSASKFSTNYCIFIQFIVFLFNNLDKFGFIKGEMAVEGVLTAT